MVIYILKFCRCVLDPVRCNTPCFFILIFFSKKILFNNNRLLQKVLLNWGEFWLILNWSVLICWSTSPFLFTDVRQVDILFFLFLCVFTYANKNALPPILSFPSVSPSVCLFVLMFVLSMDCQPNLEGRLPMNREPFLILSQNIPSSSGFIYHWFHHSRPHPFNSWFRLPTFFLPTSLLVHVLHGAIWTERVKTLYAHQSASVWRIHPQQRKGRFSFHVSLL